VDKINLKIISGGQTGADIGALRAAKKMGLETGGWMPVGFKTLAGNKPEYKQEFGMEAHMSASYSPRTFCNVRISDGTIRIANNFESSGEKCTLQAIVKYRKPNLDIGFSSSLDNNSVSFTDVELTASWIIKHNIKILNVAGNSERTSPGIEKFAESFVAYVIKYLNKSFECDWRRQLPL